MSFWKESVFTIAELSKTIVANAQSIITMLGNNTNGLGAIKTGVDGTNSALGDSTNGLAAIKTAVDAISSGGSSAIKSIQRGTGNGNATITINTIDPNKSIVILNASYGLTNASGARTTGVYLSALTANSFSVSGATDSNASYGSTVNIPYSWQVIEFN